MFEMCCLYDRSESNSTPRLRAWVVGEIDRLRKVIAELEILSRCWEVPIRRYSVLAGLTVRRF